MTLGLYDPQEMGPGRQDELARGPGLQLMVGKNDSGNSYHLLSTYRSLGGPESSLLRLNKPRRPSSYL